MSCLKHQTALAILANCSTDIAVDGHVRYNIAVSLLTQSGCRGEDLREQTEKAVLMRKELTCLRSPYKRTLSWSKTTRTPVETSFHQISYSEKLVSLATL